MTPFDPRPHDEWRALAAAYALDALDADDRAAFEQHRATCAECRALVESYEPVVTGLGLATEAEQPPASLRARTIARATAQPQPAGAVAPPLTKVTSMPVAQPRRAPSWWMVGASLAAALAFGVYSLSLKQQLSVWQTLVAQASAEVQAVRAELASVRRSSSQLASVVNVLSAADVRRVDLAGQDRARTATARAYVSGSRGLMFSAEHLPALAAGHVYQLWVLEPKAAPISVGVLTPAADGSASATMPMPTGVAPASIAGVAVTDEPSPQGSTTPTMPILLVGNAANR